MILILQLRGISITQFFKKYFPPNDNIDYSQISQELNQAFYDNDVTKNTEIRIKEIRKFIMDSHRAGITNYYSYKRCPNGDPYLLITRSGDFSES